jgi:hypothetical protein
MNYVLGKMQPTPSALKQGRLLGIVFVVIFVVLLAVYIGLGVPWDTGMIVSTAAIAFSLVGDATAYIGQPSVARYRVGLAIMVAGAAVAGASLLIWPVPF